MERAETVTLFGRSALEAYRLLDGAEPINPDAPAPVIACCQLSKLARESCKKLGLSFPLELSVPDARLRKTSKHLHAHVWKHTGLFSEPREIAPGIALPPPEVAVLQAASQLDYVDLLLLLLELMGFYRLSEKTPGGFVETTAPLLTKVCLASASRVASAACVYGSKQLGKVVRVAAEGSKSPAESKLYTLFSIDRRRGGFGISGIVLNQRMDLDKIARMHLDLGGIRPDLYEPRGRSAIEYQSRLHPVDARALDDKRADALEAQGVRVFQVDRKRARDLRDLTAIAYAMARRAGIKRRTPSEKALQARAVLHARLSLPWQTEITEGGARTEEDGCTLTGQI